MPKNRNIEPTTKAIKTVTARNGKIARLPRFVRGQLGRKPAKYIIQVENDVPGTALALPTTKKEKSRSNQPKRSRQSNQPEKPALKMSNKLKSNNIGKKRSQKPLKPSQAQSK